MRTKDDRNPKQVHPDEWPQDEPTTELDDDQLEDVAGGVSWEPGPWDSWDPNADGASSAGWGPWDA